MPSVEIDQMSEWDGKGKKFDRRKIHLTSEYHPDLQTERRQTTKPYRVVQPDRPSFMFEGHLINWEKWRFRVGFNYVQVGSSTPVQGQEPRTDHDVCYDDRELFYRLSLSEMFVPYGDGRSPYPRKAAFDLGNNGAGVNANNLQLGCDCLGAIKYFDAYHHTLSGEPLKLPNVVCCHEQDDGILWKHTKFRKNNMLLAHPDSLHAKRSEFGSHAVWVTRYHDKELYAAGKHTMQSPGGEDGIQSQIRSRHESVRNEDIVLWHTFGTTHNPRVEEWPVMPVEKMMVSLKPVNFFSRNPAMDVATSKQSANQSVLYQDAPCC